MWRGMDYVKVTDKSELLRKYCWIILFSIFKRFIKMNNGLTAANSVAPLLSSHYFSDHVRPMLYDLYCLLISFWFDFKIFFVYL